MAYITTEQVKEKRNLVKKAFPAKDGWKFSVRRQHMTNLVIELMQYPSNYDFGTEHKSVNHFHLDSSEMLTGKEREVFQKISEIAHIGHFDKSDIQTDYFHCAWYISLGIGRWDRDPVVVPAKRGKAKKEVSCTVKLEDYYKNLVKSGVDASEVLKMMYS